VTGGRHRPGVPDELLETLRMAQRFGVLGSRPVDEAVEHARAFVGALEPVRGRVVDLGSGGGLPGLVVAVDRPDLEVVLIDRRQKRTDLLERAVVRLGLEDRVRVVCDDARRLPTLFPVGFDGVTARGFGPPAVTLSTASGCLAEGGRIVVSEPPYGERWSPDMLRELGLEVHREGAVAVFRRTG
jgi:16S rRNA (guanine527-N7)-methyltransferase